MCVKEYMLDLFEKIYGSSDGVRVFFAPGRVNLIGEHTDYNGGHVFPCALTLGTYAAVRKRKDNKIRMYSKNIAKGNIIERNYGDFSVTNKNNWSNYPYGVVWALSQKGIHLEQGFDVVYYGNIPSGAGLSSSASIEVLTAYMLREIYGYKMELQDIALMCQYSENNYNGMNCGIMDQFASAMGKEGHAIFLDTAKLEYEYAPVNLENKKIVIMNTNKKHNLGTSKYNERRSESEAALRSLQTRLPIKSLGDMSAEQFEEYKYLIDNSVNRKRAKHAVYENQRTIQAYNALVANDIERFGQLMIQSHESLRDDYEVSCRELDILVAEGIDCKGVCGIRMTGGGFGGCCVSIIDSEYVDEASAIIGSRYEKAVGYKCDFYTVLPGGGPAEL